MIVEAPRRVKEAIPKTHGENFKVDVAMDTDYRYIWKRESASQCRRVYITREELQYSGLTATCPGCISMLRETARQTHTDGCNTKNRS